MAHPEINVTMDDIPDLHRVLAAMREESPLVEVRCNGERAWIILTYEALRDALRDEETFPSAASYSRTTDPAVGRTLNSMRGAEHHRNRAVVSPTFRKQRMESYRAELIEPLCHDVVDRFEGERHVDLRTVLTHLLPMEAITRLLGLPSEDSEALERWSNALFTYPFDPQGALAAKAEFTTFLERVMEQRRAEPGDDLVSTLVHGEFQGRTLDDEEILSFLRLLFPAGTHNTTNAIGNLFFALSGTARAAWRACATTPRRATGRSRRRSAGSRRSATCPAGRAPTARCSTVSSSHPTRRWCTRSPPRTATRRCSPIPIASTSTASRRRCSPSGSGSTSAWARGSGARRCASRSTWCSNARGTSRSTTSTRRVPRGGSLRGPQTLPVTIDW